MKDFEGAAQLYQDSINGGLNTNAIFCLERLQEEGYDNEHIYIEGAIQLHLRAINEGDDVDVILCVGHLLKKGYEDVPPD